MKEREKTKYKNLKSSTHYLRFVFHINRNIDETENQSTQLLIVSLISIIKKKPISTNNTNNDDNDNDNNNNHNHNNTKEKADLF